MISIYDFLPTFISMTKMEYQYYLHQDCIAEISHFINEDDMLISYSCCLKATCKSFIHRNSYIYEINHSAQYLMMFTNVKILDIRNAVSFFQLNHFKNIEKLILSPSISNITVSSPTKLMYLDSNTSIQICNIEKYINLKYLILTYSKGLESLIYLQSLSCWFNKNNSDIINLNLLSYLTKLYLISTHHTMQCMEISPNVNLIELRTENINFINKLIDGDKLTYLYLDNICNISFSNLKLIRYLHFESTRKVNILNQTDSYYHLSRLCLNTKKNMSLNFSNMTNLKHISISNCRICPNMNLSLLTSLESMIFVHNVINNVDIINLTRLTFLHFLNSPYKTAHEAYNAHRNSCHINYNIYLPKTIVSFYFEQHGIHNSDVKSSGDPWMCKILNQINDMTNLQILRMDKIALASQGIESKIFNNASITKLILNKCELIEFSHLTNLQHFVFDETNLNDRQNDNVDTKYLSSLKKLTLKKFSYISATRLKQLKSLEVLKLNFSKYQVESHIVSSLTHLIIYIRTFDETDMKLRKLIRLKSLTLNNIDLFYELCKQKFPRSLKDIYLRIDKTNHGHIPKLLMKDINVHFV